MLIEALTVSFSGVIIRSSNRLPRPCEVSSVLISITDHAVLTLALSAALWGGMGPALAEERPASNHPATNSSSFRYVDEKRPVRVHPLPPPDADPTGLGVEELRARTTALEERIERLEALIARLQAELVRTTPNERRR